jgi:heptosyltransferase-2
MVTRPADSGIRLAIRAPNWVGDLVMATPVLEAALSSARFADVRIVVRARLAGLLADGASAARVVPIASDADEVEAYRRLAPDAVLLLTNSLGATWRAWRARIPERAGSALSGRRLLLTRAFVPPSKEGRRLPTPTAELLREVARLLGIETPDLHPRLAVRGEVRAEEGLALERAGLERGAAYALCCPGASFGASKLWPAERYATVLDALHRERGFRAVVTGGPGEEALVRAVAEACSHPAIARLDGKQGLEGLKALVAGSEILLGGDSGPRWIAAAFDVPCVSVIGPNFPELTATSLERAAIARVEGLECSPCLRKTCPLGHHRCMNDLPAEPVLELARDVLGRSR